MRRSRLKLFILLLVVIALGLLSRSGYASVMPEFIQLYSGDTLWALALYILFAFVSPEVGAKELLLVSLLVAFGIEFSQLYQADWINSLRSIKLGGLILGFGFKWSDFLCYTVGILLGFIVDFQKRKFIN